MPTADRKIDDNSLALEWLLGNNLNDIKLPDQPDFNTLLKFTLDLLGFNKTLKGLIQMEKDLSTDEFKFGIGPIQPMTLEDWFKNIDHLKVLLQLFDDDEESPIGFDVSGLAPQDLVVLAIVPRLG